MTQPAGDPGPQYPSPAIADSRRLMGPNLFDALPGAVLEVQPDSAHADVLLAQWHVHVAALAQALGWQRAHAAQRLHPGGANLFLRAPVDQLMTATEVCEQAWVLAERTLEGAPLGTDDLRDRLRTMVAAEANAPFAALWDEAQRRGLNVTFDESLVAVGSGCGALRWPAREIPPAHDIDWDAVRDIPIALVTGSNGKTTVVRMLAAMARAEGHVVGYTCTDGVWIAGAQVESGDWSGPLGARRVLQDPSVTCAVLESARGGMLRRGLACQHAQVAAITTLTADHLGDYGIHDLATLADAKLIVGRAVHERGVLVYNAGIQALASRVASYDGRVLAVRDDDHVAALELSRDDLARIPATLGGAAAHNVLNARIAAAAAESLGFGQRAREALLQFGGDPRDNVGRLMMRRVGDVTVVVDYAHNAQGVAALIDATRTIPATRRLITLGTGGDRSDEAIKAIAQAAWRTGSMARVIAKEIPRVLRGRAPGEFSRLLLDALRDLGARDDQLASAPDDLTAARMALDWAGPGDLLLLAVHDQRDEVLAFLDAYGRTTSHENPPVSA